MRPVSLGRPNLRSDKIWRDWVESCFAELERASQEDLSAVAADFTVTNFTATRTLNAGTATTGDIANVLCTLIDDLRNRGMKRS
ncbi:MAG: hypothetical protein ABFC67_05945 [Mizugakiibacter sp.]|uniref:hypothetical protein n=1 Tax=Mizugakiibacter sp. TaxID=1972610 RepID=UPI00320FFB5E